MTMEDNQIRAFNNDELTNETVSEIPAGTYTAENIYLYVGTRKRCNVSKRCDDELSSLDFTISASNTDDSSDQSDGDAGSSGSDNSSGTNNSSNAFPTFTPGLDETAQDFEAPVLEAASVRDDTLDVGQTLFIDYTATDATGVDFVSFTFRDANRTFPRTLTASMKNIGLLMLTMMALLSFK